MRDIIALDEDDIIAIITRRLLEEHPLLVDKVEMGMSKSIRPTDWTNLTTIVTVYDVVDIVLSDGQRGWKDYKRWRPPEPDVEIFYQAASEFWDALCYNLFRYRNSVIVLRKKMLLVNTGALMAGICYFDLSD